MVERILRKVHCPLGRAAGLHHTHGAGCQLQSPALERATREE